jgi:hypothetical protein
MKLKASLLKGLASKLPMVWFVGSCGFGICGVFFDPSKICDLTHLVHRCQSLLRNQYITLNEGAKN